MGGSWSRGRPVPWTRGGPGLCSPERGGRRPSERGPAAVDVRKVSASDVTPTRLQVPTVVRGQCCSHHRRKDARTLEVQGGAGAKLDYRVDGSMHVKRWRFWLAWPRPYGARKAHAAVLHALRFNSKCWWGTFIHFVEHCLTVSSNRKVSGWVVLSTCGSV